MPDKILHSVDSKGPLYTRMLPGFEDIPPPESSEDVVQTPPPKPTSLLFKKLTIPLTEDFELYASVQDTTSGKKYRLSLNDDWTIASETPKVIIDFIDSLVAGLLEARMLIAAARTPPLTVHTH